MRKEVSIKRLEAQQVLGDKLVVVLMNPKTGELAKTTINPDFVIAISKML